jgi:hypothetical protein
MRMKALAFLVLIAVLIGVLAAGTPVSGDSSIRATTAGIHLSHGTAKPPSVASPPAIDRSTVLLTVLVAVSSGWVLVLVLVPPRLTSGDWRERRTSRGPPRHARA